MTEQVKTVRRAATGSRGAAAAPKHPADGHPLLAALLLLFLVGASYAGSLGAVWTLDDFPNILQNQRIQIDDLRLESLGQTVYAPQPPDSDTPPRVNRPLAYLSFALNWYIGHAMPEGYRLVNVAIHFGNACLLFLVLRALLATPRVSGRYPGQENSIAFFAAALWALNPIQSQAVVYIVQRMASLACLFYLSAIWGYLRLRQADGPVRKTGFLLIVTACFVAGVGSKENAIVLPAALALLELCFFQEPGDPRVKRWIRRGLACGLGALAVVAGWVFLKGEVGSVFGYGSRLFTPWERLLTQARVLWFYLSQIFYPVPTRLSIIHDVEISRSLLEPWTTLPAVLALLLVVGLGFYLIRKRPIPAFAILFFFLNHVVESSILGLELIFEHRNYLPSLFLFFPVSVGILTLIERYRAKRSAFRYMIMGFAVLCLLLFGVGTRIRTLAWSDARTLWEDAALKAPGSMRPLHNLAYEHYEKQRQYKKAFDLYQKSLTLKDQNRKGRAIGHTNIANYYYRTGDFAKAKEHLDEAAGISPEIDHILYFRAVVLLQLRQSGTARSALGPLLDRHPGSYRYNFLMAQILLDEGNAQEALSHLQTCLAQAPESTETHALLGVALSLSGNLKQAALHLRAAVEGNPRDRSSLLWLTYCSLMDSDPASASGYAAKFRDGLDAHVVEEAISGALGDGLMPTAARERLTQWVLAQADPEATPAASSISK